jgi:hypothetical protein
MQKVEVRIPGRRAQDILCELAIAAIMKPSSVSTATLKKRLTARFQGGKACLQASPMS